jgi:tetratricopeptide (TPR) repeat protein
MERPYMGILGASISFSCTTTGVSMKNPAQLRKIKTFASNICQIFQLLYSEFLNCKNHQIKFFILLFIMLSATSTYPAACGGDSTWEAFSFSQKVSSLQSHLNSTSIECLASALASIDRNVDENAVKDFISLLQKWAKTNTVDHQLLFAGYSNEFIHRNNTTWQAIESLWGKSNTSPYAAIVSLANSGEPLIADTLLRILDSEGKVDVPELLRWAKIKIVIHDYALVPALYCRIMGKKAQTSKDSASLLRAQSLALSQFSSQIDEIRGETADQLLQQYKKCTLEMPDADSSSIRSWLAQTYSHLGMFDRELEILTLIVPSESVATLGADLADLARERFLYQQYIPALRAAKASFANTQDGEIKADAASIIYQSFQTLGLQDSALIWLKKANLTTDNRIIDAVVLYQNSGQIQQSQAFIDKLGPSLVKDTLQIRTFIMSNNIEKARSRLNESTFLKKSPPEKLLWNVRILLFTNKIAEVAATLDSSTIPVGHDFAKELLLYKYWLERLKDCPEALSAWTAIEYNIYLGKLEKCLLLSQNERIGKACQWRLALRVARVFHEKMNLSAAVETMNCCNEKDVSAEFLYFKAQYLYEFGKIALAKELLQRIILDFTNEIYSGKARLLLSKMELDQ